MSKTKWIKVTDDRHIAQAGERVVWVWHAGPNDWRYGTVGPAPVSIHALDDSRRIHGRADVASTYGAPTRALAKLDAALFGICLDRAERPTRQLHLGDLVTAWHKSAPMAKAEHDERFRAFLRRRSGLRAEGAAGPVARHVMATIRRLGTMHDTSEFQDNERHYAYALVTETGLQDRKGEGVADKVRRFEAARKAAWEAAKADARVPCHQVARTTGRAFYLLYVGTAGEFDLCEAGVYISREQADAAATECNEQHADGVARHGWRHPLASPYMVAESLAGVNCSDIDVRGSLLPWQLALLPARPIEPAKVKAGPVARLVAEEIACELSGQSLDNPPYYESAVVQAFAGRFPSESAYGKALQNASAAHDADCAVPLPDRPSGLYSVAVYHVERVFGGHEEGGWYYTAGDLAPEFGVHLRMFEREGAAYAYARTLTDTVIAEANQGRRPLSSVLSDGAYQARVAPGFAPQHFPETRPYYE